MKKKTKNKIKQNKTKNQKPHKWSQPRIRLDLPPGGFLRPPVAALAPPDGSEGCGISFCCCSSCCSCGSTSSGHSLVACSWPFSTSCLVWFQTMAAPELWMVVSSGCGFLGKRRGCWHRLRGAEGSPQRVPVGTPVGGLFLRRAWGSSGSAKMLEAILLLRWGVESSSVPRVKLEVPPGGRSTLELLLEPGLIP